MSWCDNMCLRWGVLLLPAGYNGFARRCGCAVPAICSLCLRACVFVPHLFVLQPQRQRSGDLESKVKELPRLEARLASEKEQAAELQLRVRRLKLGFLALLFLARHSQTTSPLPRC
jgi:hypothetical protein